MRKRTEHKVDLKYTQFTLTHLHDEQKRKTKREAHSKQFTPHSEREREGFLEGQGENSRILTLPLLWRRRCCAVATADSNDSWGSNMAKLYTYRHT